MWRVVVRNKSGKASWIQTAGDLEWQAEKAGWPRRTAYQRRALYTEVGSKPQNTEWCKHTEVA